MSKSYQSGHVSTSDELQNTLRDYVNSRCRWAAKFKDQNKAALHKSVHVRKPERQEKQGKKESINETAL